MKDESNQLGTMALSRQAPMKEGGGKSTEEKHNGDMEEDMRAEMLRQ